MESAEWSVFGRIVWEDYIVWAVGCKERVLVVLAEEMGKVRIEERKLGFDLSAKE